MNNTVRLSFRYSEEDYVRALRLHYSDILQPKRDVAISAVTMLLGTYFWATSDSRWLGPVLVLISAILLLMIFSAFVLIPPAIFRREPKFKDDYALTFSAEGIHFETAHINSNLQWVMYTQVLVDSCSYVLYYGKSSLTVIPARVFESPDQRAQFDALLAQFIPKITRKGTGVGAN